MTSFDREGDIRERVARKTRQMRTLREKLLISIRKSHDAPSRIEGGEPDGEALDCKSRDRRFDSGTPFHGDRG